MAQTATNFLYECQCPARRLHSRTAITLLNRRFFFCPFVPFHRLKVSIAVRNHHRGDECDSLFRSDYRCYTGLPCRHHDFHQKGDFRYHHHFLYTISRWQYFIAGHFRKKFTHAPVINHLFYFNWWRTGRGDRLNCGCSHRGDRENCFSASAFTIPETGGGGIIFLMFKKR